jgi:signal transduction histidine kinase/DNA-binding response OmpR family regulator
MRGALTPNRVVLLAAVPIFLILATIAAITVLFAANERAAQRMVTHTYQVMGSLRQILGDATDAETGSRGFVLTGDPTFLAPAQAARARVERDLARFKQLTADNPSQQRRRDRLTALIQERLAVLDMAQRVTAPRNSLEMVQIMTRGKALMDALRDEIAKGMAEEQGLLRQRDQQEADQKNYEVGFAVSVSLLALAVLLAAAALLVRNNVQLAEAERMRAREANLVQATLDNVRDGVAYFGADGRLTAFNRQFFRLMDFPDALASSTTMLSELARLEKDRPRSVLIPEHPEDGTSDPIRISWGGRELEVYRAPVAAGGFLVGVLDITARVKAENMVRQSQKMEAIGHLTGGVAHDFNNLLQVINANLELAAAADEVKANPAISRRMENAINAVSRGTRLVGQLLAFARRQALEPRSVNLGRVIGDMTDLLRRTLGDNIKVEAAIAGGLWNTLADPDQVETTILNLAINARDAMPDGGKLTLEAANAYLDEAYAANHEEATPGQYVMLAVSDTGCGMAPEVIAHVFEPFFTTKPEGKGTGLGLAQAYGFVKQSGGHIKIYSAPGEGTTVKLYLPRTRRAEEMDAPVTVKSVVGGSERILVVEDDDDVREAAAAMLRELGYSVQTAGNGEAALRQLQEGSKPELLFTDVVMPGSMSTREFARRVRQMRPGIRILYTSGYIQDAIAHDGRLDEDAFLLSKPYRKDELARKIRAVLAELPGHEVVADKVLVVEDVPVIRMATVDMIEQIGLRASEAGDGPEALALLEKDPEIAVLITDLGLPGMDGRQLVEKARLLKPGLKVIIASGYSGDVKDHGYGIGHLTKPFDVGALRRALEA